MPHWILFTLLAAVMQSVRTAGQKHMALRLSPAAASAARFLFGLPFVVLYFLAVRHAHRGESLSPQPAFHYWAILAALAQIVATLCLVRALGLRNFAVGTALAKTEALMTAVLGSLLFAVPLGALGYAAVCIGVAGALLAVNRRWSFADLKGNASLHLGLAAGGGFALAALSLREAILSLQVSSVLGAAFTLLYMVALQSLLCLLWMALRQPAQLRGFGRGFGGCLFIGFTGVAGSAGWFTAMALQNPALVKTLGQVEFLITLLITWKFFGETISRREYLGMGLILSSVILLLYV